MDKLYAEEKIAVVNPPISVETGPGIAEKLQRTTSGYLSILPTSALQKSSYRIMKRTIDLVVSFMVIVCILSWLIPLLAILIKLDSKGPVFFLQKRNKRNGQGFTCIKFRTMFVNEQANELAACKNDPRITRLGNFLRNHYLDELPQFFNVLMGDMSTIGPRPHMISDDLKFEKQVHNYILRLHVKPGITGLAQVLGYSGHIENLQSIKSRVNMDLYYISHWSPKLDRIIFYRSIFKILGI